MQYLILVLIIVIALILFLQQKNKRRQKKKIEQLHSTWAKPKDEQFYFNRIRNYADTVKENKFHLLTEQTIEDIDFYQLFTAIDRTTSKVGQQFLFKKLIEPSDNFNDPAQKLIELFTNNPGLREEIQLELLALSHSDAYNIPSLMQDNLVERPKWLPLFYVNIIISIALIILSFSNPVFLVMLLFPFTMNMVLHYWNKTNSFYFISSLPQLNILINVSRMVSKKHDLLYSKKVEEGISNLKSFQLKTSLINLDTGVGIQSELSQLATYLIELIKGFFLIEVFTFFHVIKELQAKRDSVITLFNHVGNIDASIAIASLRAGKLKTCQPVLVPAKKEIFARNLYHPLIEKCGENTLSINGKSILITGSNMSGKSTFLRTLTINSILAQTIHTCFADEFVSPILKQFSSIRTDDNLFKGASYFFQEVKIIASLVEEVETPYQNLFILDEVFKGTNTVERVSAAKAILSYLNRNKNIVIVSTHDIELCQMLDKEYDLYHFSETIENNQLHFDYIIKHGPLRTRNAIKILELSDYPIDIITEAQQLATSQQFKQIKSQDLHHGQQKVDKS